MTSVISNSLQFCMWFIRVSVISIRVVWVINSFLLSTTQNNFTPLWHLVLYMDRLHFISKGYSRRPASKHHLYNAYLSVLRNRVLNKSIWNHFSFSLFFNAETWGKELLMLLMSTPALRNNAAVGRFDFDHPALRGPGWKVDKCSFWYLAHKTLILGLDNIIKSRLTIPNLWFTQ